MKRYRSKLETVDPERGDCLMLYADTVELIGALDEKDRDNVIQAMFSWFLGAEEQSVIDGLVRTASKIATQILKSVIEKQKRNAGKFIEKCLKQQQRRLGHPRFPTVPSAETATVENTQPDGTTTVNQL